MAPHFTIAILENFKDARVHYAVLKQRTNPPGNPYHHTQQPDQLQEPVSVSGYDTNLVTRTRTRNTRHMAGCLRTQQCAWRTTTTRSTAFQPVTSTGVLAVNPDSRRLFVNVPPMSNHPRHVRPGPGLCHQHQPVLRRAGRRPHNMGPDGDELLRKEVIQPHLPVRLPCYDLVPIASPTFDHSLPQGVGP